MVVECLIIAGANINAIDTEGETALHVASCNGCDMVVKKFVTAGADMNRINNIGNTALFSSVLEDKRICLARLLMEGADDTILNHEGETAFQMAVRLGRPYGVMEAWNLNLGGNEGGHV